MNNKNVDEIEAASRELERAKGWAADTANLLVACWKDSGSRVRRVGGESFALVPAPDFDELRLAVEEWQKASQAFVDAVQKNSGSGRG